MRRLFLGQRDSGAAAVETALVLPIIILIVFGIVEFGVLFNRLQGVHAASRESARLGSLFGVTNDEIRERAEASGPPFLKDTNPADGVMDDLQVTVSRVDILGDGSSVVTQLGHWNPDADSDDVPDAAPAWSAAGEATAIPCATEPDPSDPPAAGEIVSVNVRVELQLLNSSDYGVVIPLFGSFAFGHPSIAEFRCEF